MKISYAEYLKKTDASVLVAEAIFSELFSKFPLLKISDIADTTSGGTPLRSNAEYHNGTIPWLKSGELNDKWIEEAEEFITEEGLLNSSAKLLPEGTLLLAMYGATAGRTGITRIKAATNQAVCALFPNEKVTQEYLFWFLRQHRYYFIEISKGGAQPNISQSVIKGTLLPVPDKVLQTRIANILSTIESTGRIDLDIVPSEFKGKVNKVLASKNNVLEITTEVNHQLTIVKKLRQQLLQDAVQGKLVQQDRNEEPASELLKKIKAEKAKDKKYKELPAIKPDEVPFDIPDNWVWCKLGDVCSKIGSGSTPNGGNYSKDGIPFFRSQNIHDSGLVYNDIKFISSEVHNRMSGTITYANDILLNITGGSMGRCTLVPNDFQEGNVSQHVCIIRPLLVDNRFYHKVILSPFFQALIFSSTTGAGREGLPKYNLEQFLIPLPPIAEQHRIVRKLEEIMQTCDEMEASITASKGQNEQLLQQVLREAFTNRTN